MSELTLEEQQFLDECQKAGVPDEFRDKWLKRYFAALDNNKPLPPPPWSYRPAGKLRWTPDLTNYELNPLTDDDREEITLLIQYET
jgi:hypothetical protein